MIQIRHGVFETNSSSTHSICIFTQEEYDKWMRCEMIYDQYAEKIVPIDEDVNNNRYRYKTYNAYCNDYTLEGYEEKFTTPSGDKMVVFGEYGYDG